MAHTIRVRHPHVSHDHRIVSNAAVFASMFGAIVLLVLILWAVFAARPVAAPSVDPTPSGPVVPATE